MARLKLWIPEKAEALLKSSEQGRHSIKKDRKKKEPKESGAKCKQKLRGPQRKSSAS